MEARNIMEYRIDNLGEDFEGRMVENRGGGEYTIGINNTEHSLRILSAGPRGIEFILDQEYHSAKYLESLTSKMSLVVDGVPVQIRMHTGLDEIVYKNSGGRGEDSQTGLRSQIPGKVVSFSVSEGDEVKEGDPIVVLESMKMQVEVKSHKDGTIKSIKVKQGGSVAKNDVIAEIE